MAEPTRGRHEPVIRYFPDGSEIRWSHCPLGWVKLLDQITAALDEYLPGWQLRQVKSDLGTLDFYFDTPDAATFEQRATVRAVYRAARTRSTSTCEVCGAPGRRAQRADWVSVLCDHHQVMAASQVPLVELRVRGRCARCGHRETSHAPDSRLPSAPRVCLEPAGMGTECGCPLVEMLPVDATGDFEVMTSHGTRYFLRLGGDDPSWFRSPGPNSRTDYAGRWNRLGSLRSDVDEQQPRRSAREHGLRVGAPFTIGIGTFCDLMHATAIAWIRQVLDPADLPPRVEYCFRCARNRVEEADQECADCRGQ